MLITDLATFVTYAKPELTKNIERWIAKFK